MANCVLLATALLGSLVLLHGASAKKPAKPGRGLRTTNVDTGYGRWNKTSIPFCFDASLDANEQTAVQQGINSLVGSTTNAGTPCFTFTQVQCTAAVYKLKFQAVSGAASFSDPGTNLVQLNNSYYSTAYYNQAVNLSRDDGCSTNPRCTQRWTVYAMGKRNEHERGDRNTYITVNQASMSANNLAKYYRIYGSNEAYWGKYGYDYCSITHNSPTDYANAGMQAFGVLQSPYCIPQMPTISNTDCLLLSTLYMCPNAPCSAIPLCSTQSCPTTTAAPVSTTTASSGATSAVSGSTVSGASTTPVSGSTGASSASTSAGASTSPVSGSTTVSPSSTSPGSTTAVSGSTSAPPSSTSPGASTTAVSGSTSPAASSTSPASTTPVSGSTSPAPSSTSPGSSTVSGSTSASSGPTSPASSTASGSTSSAPSSTSPGSTVSGSTSAAPSSTSPGSTVSGSTSAAPSSTSPGSTVSGSTSPAPSSTSPSSTVSGSTSPSPSSTSPGSTVSGSTSAAPSSTSPSSTASGSTSAAPSSTSPSSTASGSTSAAPSSTSPGSTSVAPSSTSPGSTASGSTSAAPSSTSPGSTVSGSTSAAPSSTSSGSTVSGSTSAAPSSTSPGSTTTAPPSTSSGSTVSGSTSAAPSSTSPGSTTPAASSTSPAPTSAASSTSPAPSSTSPASPTTTAAPTTTVAGTTLTTTAPTTTATGTTTPSTGSTTVGPCVDFCLDATPIDEATRLYNGNYYMFSGDCMVQVDETNKLIGPSVHIGTILTGVTGPVKSAWTDKYSNTYIVTASAEFKCTQASNCQPTSILDSPQMRWESSPTSLITYSYNPTGTPAYTNDILSSTTPVFAAACNGGTCYIDNANWKAAYMVAGPSGINPITVIGTSTAGVRYLAAMLPGKFFNPSASADAYQFINQGVTLNSVLGCPNAAAG